MSAPQKCPACSSPLLWVNGSLACVKKPCEQWGEPVDVESKGKP